MNLTIAYLTFRLRPHFDWFAKSLARELRSMPDLSSENVQILVIDGRLWYDGKRHLELLDAAGGRIRFEHHPPKPSVWQGPNRLTKRDFFDAAGVRNAAIALARGDHVIFIDDLSVLLPGWLKAHMHAAQHGYVLCGTTCKNKNIVVSDQGDVVSYDLFPPGQDSRLRTFGEGLQTVSGDYLYGGTFSVPMKFALAVNGQDEICTPIGGEDYDFGIRLERAGAVVRITRDCGTFEDEDGHHTEAPMIRLDKPWPGPQGPYVSNLLLNRLRAELSRVWTAGNEYKLSELRDHVLKGNPFPVPTQPTSYFSDGQPLSEM